MTFRPPRGAASALLAAALAAAAPAPAPGTPPGPVPHGRPPFAGPPPGARGDTALYWQAGKVIGRSISYPNGTETHFDVPPDGEVVRHLRNDPAKPVIMRIRYAKGAKTYAILYRPDGSKSAEMELQGDMQQGIYKSYHPNGRLLDSCRKDHGRVEGVLENFDDRGHLLHRDRYRAGRQNGPSESYYPDGRLQSSFNYKDGMRDGAFKTWDKDGALATAGAYAMGVPAGTWEEYFPTGQVRVRTRLSEWRILERQCFGDDGRAVLCRDEDEERRALEGMRRAYERRRPGPMPPPPQAPAP